MSEGQSNAVKTIQWSNMVVEGFRSAERDILCKQEAPCRNSVLLAASTRAKGLGKESASSVEGTTGKCLRERGAVRQTWGSQRR